MGIEKSKEEKHLNKTIAIVEEQLEKARERALKIESDIKETRQDLRDNSEHSIALFNQDDEVLEWWGATLVDDQWVAKFAVKGIDISKLKMFLSDESITLAKAQDIKQAKEIAIWNTDINVK